MAIKTLATRRRAQRAKKKRITIEAANKRASRNRTATMNRGKKAPRRSRSNALPPKLVVAGRQGSVVRESESSRRAKNVAAKSTLAPTSSRAISSRATTKDLNKKPVRSSRAQTSSEQNASMRVTFKKTPIGRIRDKAKSVRDKKAKRRAFLLKNRKRVTFKDDSVLSSMREIDKELAARRKKKKAEKAKRTPRGSGIMRRR